MGCKPLRRETGVALTTNRVGGMFGIFFTDQTGRNVCSGHGLRHRAVQPFLPRHAQRGVYLAPSAFEAGFLSSAHSDDVIGETLSRRAHRN